MFEIPYRLPNKPRVTIRQVLAFAVRKGAVSLADLVRQFRMTKGDASVRLLKLHRWGYLARKKESTPRRAFLYWPTRFGRTSARRWAKEA